MADEKQRWLSRGEAATALGVRPEHVIRLAADPDCPLPPGEKRDGRRLYYPLKGEESVESARKWMLEMQGCVEDYQPLTPDRLRAIGVRQMTSARGRPDKVAEINRKIAAVKARRVNPEPKDPVDERIIAKELGAAMRKALGRCAPELGEDPKARQQLEQWVTKLACVVAGMKRTRRYVR